MAVDVSSSVSSYDEMGPISAINVTPFVDVVLVLLVIFMVTAPVLMKDSLGIQLPKAVNGDQSPAPSFGLAVTRSGQLMLNGQEASDDGVIAEAKAQVQKNPDFQVIISADSQALHQDVVRAVDLVKTAGVQKFALEIQRTQ